MPIYEYECECGARLESLESISAVRKHCDELCKRADGDSRRGHGAVQKLMSVSGIRGDGKEAREPVFSPVKRQARPGCEDCDCSVT